MGNISQSSKRSALKGFDVYFQHEQKQNKMKVEFIPIKDVQPNFYEEVLIIKDGNINTIQVAKYDKIETNKNGNEYLFYDGIKSNFTISHWLPKGVLKINK